MNSSLDNQGQFYTTILIMFKLKASEKTARVYSKTQPDQTTKNEEVLIREQEAKDQLYQLSIFHNDSTISNHLNAWVQYGKEPPKQEERRHRTRQDKIMEETLSNLRRRGTEMIKKETFTFTEMIKKETFTFLRKKKYERQCQLKKTIKNAVRESRQKHSCTAMNFDLPSQNVFHHDRIHSYSMRLHPEIDRTAKQNHSYSHTTPLLSQNLLCQDSKNLKLHSRISQFKKSSKRFHSSMLVHKKRSSLQNPLSIKVKPETFTSEKDSLKECLGTLNNLLAVEKQRICLSVKEYQCQSRISVTMRRRKKRFLAN